MANVNKITLIGRITRDIELRHTPSGTALTDLGLAVNRRRKEGDNYVEETTFIDVTLWARQAELAAEYLEKGREVYIEGRLQMDTWEDKETGKTRSKLKVVGENMQFLGGVLGGKSETPKAAPAAAPNNLETADDIPF